MIKVTTKKIYYYRSCTCIRNHIARSHSKFGEIEKQEGKITLLVEYTSPLVCTPQQYIGVHLCRT